MSTRFTAQRLARALSTLQGKRVGIIGDVILDEFLWGDATRISPEAPVPVVLLEHRTWSLGGAANVAANVAALEGQALLFSTVGDDVAGERLRQLATDAGIELGFLPALPQRPTTVKHRVFARNKHLLRFDQESTTPIGVKPGRELLRALEAAMPRLQAVLVSDYAKGCVTPELARGIARLCQRYRVPWCVDPKQTNIRYRGATLLKPNTLELEALAGIVVKDKDDLRRAALGTLRRQGCQNLLVTRGQHGMALFRANGKELWLNSSGQAVSDVTGAGDTVNAVLGLGLAAHLSLGATAALAQCAAAFVITQAGTAVARPGDLLAHIK